jgi:tyrosinase
MSGLGGWGDPNHDYQVPLGGFSKFHLSYPSPHTLRRHFNLQPWFALSVNSTLVTDPSFIANISFTEKEVKKLVHGFVGDFKGFQQYFESINVHSGSILFVQNIVDSGV